MDSHTWESIISCNSREKERDNSQDIPSIVDIYLSAIYFRAIFVNKRIYIDEASSNLCETLYMWNEDTMRSEARNRKKGEKRKPIRPGIRYLFKNRISMF